MTVSDNTTKAEGLGSSSKKLGENSAKASKKSATNASKNQLDFLKSVLKLLLRLQAEIQEQFYRHYLKQLISTTQAKTFIMEKFV